MTIRLARRLIAGIAITALAAAGCSSDSSSTKAASKPGDSSRAVAGDSTSSSTSSKASTDVDAANPKYAKTGPYPVGVTTLTLGDRKVEVWYPSTASATEGKTKDSYAIKSWLAPTLTALLPADVNPLFETDAYRDVTAASDGPYPLILFRHGYAGYRDQSTFLTTHLASWGFVVASPDQREIGLEFLGGIAGKPDVPRDAQEVMRSTVDLVRSENDSTTSVLHSIVKPGKIGVTGHSMGGFASAQFASQPDVGVYVPLAAGIGNDGDTEAAAVKPANVPSLFMFGSIDTVVPPETTRAAFAAAEPPTRLVVLGGSGHLNGFSDICMIGASGGGIVKLAIDNGLPVPENLTKLGTDGCQAEATPSKDLWPVTDHFVTAMMRYYLGLDEEPIGLNASTAKTFTGFRVTYKERLTAAPAAASSSSTVEP